MTIVASWINNETPEYPRLWTVTDTELSSSEHERPIFNAGAKLFNIRVICSKPNNEGFFNDIYFTTTIGMTFSGSSLLALNLHALLSYTLGNLANIKQEIPSMNDIAEHVYSAFKLIIYNYIELNLKSTPLEVSMFGFCTRLNTHQIYHLKHSGSDRNTSCKNIALDDREAVHLMGAHQHQDEIKKIIAQYRSTLPDKNGIAWNRAPKIIIDNIIANHKYKTIGGSLQLGICDCNGFRLYSMCYPIKHGEPLSTIIYQNIDLNSNAALRAVGNCFLSTHTMV